MPTFFASLAIIGVLLQMMAMTALVSWSRFAPLGEGCSLQCGVCTRPWTATFTKVKQPRYGTASDPTHLQYLEAYRAERAPGENVRSAPAVQKATHTHCRSQGKAVAYSDGALRERREHRCHGAEQPLVNRKMRRLRERERCRKRFVEHGGVSEEAVLFECCVIISGACPEAKCLGGRRGCLMYFLF